MEVLVSAMLSEAHLKESQNQLSEAIQLYENVLNTDREAYCAYNSLGNLYEKVNDEYNAVQTYKKGIQMAKQQRNKMVESELSYTLLGLID